jgi:hypothetical protein
MNSNLAKKYNYDDEDEFDETRMEPQDIVEVKELKVPITMYSLAYRCRVPADQLR